MTTKLCLTCNKDQNIENFPFTGKDKKYRKNKCNSCQADYQRAYRDADPEAMKDRWKKASKKYYTTDKRRNRTLREYGLDESTYNELFDKQNGACKICGKEVTLVVDHDHATGKVRGLLCNGCNVGLGCFEDTIVNLMRAIDYLGAA